MSLANKPLDKRAMTAAFVLMRWPRWINLKECAETALCSEDEAREVLDRLVDQEIVELRTMKDGMIRRYRWIDTFWLPGC